MLHCLFSTHLNSALPLKTTQKSHTIFSCVRPYLFCDPCTTRYINSNEGEEVKCDAEAINNLINEWHAGFPNLTVSINRIVSGQCYISAYCTISGLHAGKWRGIEPTHRFVIADVMMILKIANGKIAEKLIMIDYLGLYRQMGVLQNVQLLTA